MANEEINNSRGAVYLIDDNTFSSRFYHGGASGWDLDARCKTVPRVRINGNPLCTDAAGIYDVYGKRDISPVMQGRAGFHNSFTVYYGEGFYIRFMDAARKKITFELAAASGVFTANGRPTDSPCTSGTYFFEIQFDADAKEALLYINNRNAGTYALASEGIGRLIYGVRAGSDTCVLPGFTRLYTDYLLVDRCACYIPAPLGDRWLLSGASAKAELIPAAEGHVYALYSKAEASASVVRRFPTAHGKVDCEIMCRFTHPASVGEVSLLCGDASVVTLKDTDNRIFCGETLLRWHGGGVWQTLRIVADTVTRDVDLYVNYKKCGSTKLPASVSCLDGIRLAVSGREDAALYFTHVCVKPLYPEPADYVPAPRVPEKNGYNVGINVCSLWRNGHHFGWDVITPYPENKTYLGWYDEGLPEVADWEIKWLCESGVDCELYCWYNGRENAPLIRPGLYHAMFDGHLKAKYAEYMKFGIIWEAANGAPTNAESFRKYMVPYWMDYFFSDKRYFTLHNKVVISVFGAGNLIHDFGSPENVAKAFDYVREQVKTLGYDGAYFMACGAPSEIIRQCGFDAVHAYSWGMSGYSPDYSKVRMEMQLENKAVPVVPTVSCGFNGIAWGYDRTPLMTPADMGKMFTWIKDDLMPRTGTDGDFVMLSTWNEYGEGTYLCPAEVNGFGYLEQVRTAFTKPQSDFEWVRPNEKQLARLGYLYPTDRALLRCRRQAIVRYPDTVIGELSCDSKNWTAENDVTMKNDGTSLCLHGPIYDPKIYTNTAIDADVVKNIRITMRGGTFGDAVIVYFKRETDGDWSEECSARAYFDTTERRTYDIFVGGCGNWTGRIKGIRIDPGDLAGDYVIEKIELCTDASPCKLCIDGNVCRLPFAPQFENGVPLIPFEHGGDVMKYMNLYCEWHPQTETLLLLKEDTPLTLTVGCDMADFGGRKIALGQPLGLYDGVPMLNAQVLAEVFGYSLSVVDGSIALLRM